MNGKLTTYKTFRDRISNLMLYGGIKPHRGAIHLRRIIALYGIFLFVVLFAKVFFFLATHVKNVLLITHGTSIVFSLSTIILKISVCLIYREDFLILDEKLGQKFEQELEKEENQPVMLEKISLYKIFMYVVATMLCVSLSMYTIVPTINVLVNKKFVQIWMGKYPFTVIPGKPLYWAIYLFEISFAYFFWTVMNGVDNAFGLYCFQTCGLFRLAAQRLMDIQPENPNYKSQLRECVEIHQLVMRAKNALQRAYGVMVIWINITNSIIMCTLMWQANQLKNVMTIYKALHFACFVTLKLLQSFTYAYYGSLVSRENDNYQNAIYMSNWPGSGNVRFMKDLLFILTQRTVTLKACGFFFITMEMFEKIVNTTISYFFLLQTLDAKR